MDPIFTEEQLNRMSREDMCSLLKLMQQHQQKQEEALQRQEERLQNQETKIRMLEEQKKELEFLNAMLSDRLTLARRKRFGASSEKYADGYTQLNLFNEAEKEADADAPEPDLEEVPIRLLTGGRNVPAKKKKTFPPLKQPKWWNTSWRARTNTVRTAAPNIKWSQRKP